MATRTKPSPRRAIQRATQGQRGQSRANRLIDRYGDVIGRDDMLELLDVIGHEEEYIRGNHDEIIPVVIRHF